MQQYSIIVTASTDVVIADPILTLEAGRSITTVFTGNIDALLRTLALCGVLVHSVNLIEQPPTTRDDLLLEGESPTVLNDYARRP